MPDLPGINYQLHPKRKKVKESSEEEWRTSNVQHGHRMEEIGKNPGGVAKYAKERGREVAAEHSAKRSVAAKKRAKKGLMSAEEAVVRALLGGR